MSRRDFNNDLSSGLILAGKIATITAAALLALALGHTITKALANVVAFNIEQNSRW